MMARKKDMKGKKNHYLPAGWIASTSPMPSPDSALGRRSRGKLFHDITRGCEGGLEMLRPVMPLVGRLIGECTHRVVGHGPRPRVVHVQDCVEDRRAHDVVCIRPDERLLERIVAHGLTTCPETRPEHNAVATKSKSGSETAAVADAASREHDWSPSIYSTSRSVLACKRDDSRGQGQSAGPKLGAQSMAAGFTALCDHTIDTGRERSLCVADAAHLRDHLGAGRVRQLHVAMRAIGLGDQRWGEELHHRRSMLVEGRLKALKPIAGRAVANETERELRVWSAAAKKTDLLTKELRISKVASGDEAKRSGSRRCRS